MQLLENDSLLSKIPLIFENLGDLDNAGHLTDKPGHKGLATLDADDMQTWENISCERA